MRLEDFLDTPSADSDEDQFDSLVNAIRHVESRGKSNAVSPQGASGSMQIMPGTFRQYAAPGERFDNDEDRTRAAIRKLQDDYAFYDGDVERTAAAYIGGRGAVRKDGAIRDDVKDALGTTPLAYARMVTGRMGKSSVVRESAADQTDDEFSAFDKYLSGRVIDPEVIDAPKAEVKSPKNSGLFGTLKAGLRGTGRAIGAAIDLHQLDNDELAGAVKSQQADLAQQDESLAALKSDIQSRKERLGKDAGWFETGKELLSAMASNPKGSALLVAEQLPNSAAALGSGWAGAKVGSMAGGALGGLPGAAIGGVTGFVTGMFGANYALEGGNKAIEAAASGPLSEADKQRVIGEGAAKAGVITGVDAVTLGIGGKVAGVAQRAVDRAGARVLTEAGVDATDRAAVLAAVRQNPALIGAVKEAEEAAFKASTTLGQRAIQGGTGLALETFGEGLGEYAGEGVATGNWDKMEAMIEAFSSLGQSGVETGYNIAKNNEQFENLSRAASMQKTMDSIAQAEQTKVAAQQAIATAPTVDAAVDAFNVATAAGSSSMVDQSQLLNDVNEATNASIATPLAEETTQANDAQVGAEQAAAPLLTVPQQPTTTKPLEQTPVAMPIPKGIAAGQSVESLRQKMEATEPFTEESAILQERLQLAVTADAVRSIRGGSMPVYQVSQNSFVTISPSAQNPGKFQVTRYNNKGVFGDSQYNTIEEAIRSEGLWVNPRLSEADAGALLQQSLTAESEFQSKKSEPTKPTKPKKDRKAVYPESDSALVAIAKLGGMDTQQLLTNGFDQSDISVQKGAKVSKKTGQLGKAPFRAKQVGFNMPIHRNGGMSFDGMREALVQYGYLPEDASVNDAIELLRRELRGEPVYTASAVQAQAEAAEADRQAMMEAEQEANEASGYDDLQGTAEERAADALIEELYGEEVAALARGMRVAGLTEEEINAEIEAFNQRTGAQDGAGQSQERSGEGRAEESGTDAEVFVGKEGAEPDWLSELFGDSANTPEPAAKPKSKIDLTGLVGALRAFSQKKLDEANDWASRKYKDNKTKINFEGDGPTRNESISVSAANESRRNRTVDALQKQAQMASNLANRIERGFDVQAEIAQAIRDAESDIARDGKPRFGGTRETQVEAYISKSMLGDDLYGYGEGTVANLIRKAYEQPSTVNAENEQKSAFSLAGQTNEEAAAEYKQQQAPEEISKDQIDREVDGFGLQQESQPKPQGVQGGMFTADGRVSSDAAQAESAKDVRTIAEGTTEREIELRRLSHDIEQPGDVELGNGKFVTLAQAKAAAQAAIDDGVLRPTAPFQYHNILDIAPRDWNRMVAEMTAVNAENVAKSEVTKPATKIADFGEKIGGAKKDVWTSHKDKLDDAAKLDIKVEPLSKSWPEPNYQSLIDAGADPFVVAFMRASRDAIPRKPTAKWKLKSWAGSVELLRDTSAKLLSGEIDANRAKELLQKAGDVSSNMRKIAGRIELYQLVGHRQSLDGVSLEFHHYTLYKGQENVSIWSIEKEAKATAFSNWPAEIVTGKTKTEVLDKFKEMYDKIDLNKKADRTVSFDLYSQGNKFYVGKKMGRNITQLAGPFDTVKEARAYRTDNQEELIARLEKAKEIPAVRRDTNNPRVGEDMRGGQDVTPELFAETFGFKGVEFGNWVEQKKRQKDLNDSFDALMDMAAIIGVPPKALSLNGELGLAFGARGSGGVDPAAAHYEPGKVVINLTKKEGAGSLGHEWWHALDNYFSRLRGKGGEFTTQALDVSLADRESQFIANTPVRKEMIEAFGAVMRAIRMTALKARSSKLDAKRSKEYWTGKEEMSARAFESYLISKLQDQNASNDYLANIVDQDTWKAAESLGFELDDSYPYPTAGEMPLIREAFDRFFDTVQTKETEQGVAFFSPASPSDAVKNTLLKQAEEAPDPVTTEMEWNSLFPNRRIDTPIETLRMGANQFYKLIGNQRSRFSGMVFPTLDRPLFVFEDTDGSHVYVKSFTEGNGVKTFISVAAHIDGTFTVISNGIRGTNSIADRVVSARESGRLLHTAYAADAPNRSATTESEAQPSHAGGLDLNIADDGSEFNDLSEVKQYAVRQAIDRAIAIEQGLAVEPIRRESALLKLRRLRRQLDEGKITEGQFIFDVNMLHQSLENASAAKKFAPVKERARGADYIRQKLLEAKRRGDISEETADMTEWFVLQNPALVDDLGISIRTASDAEQGSRGRYMPATRVMRLFKENAATETGVHEILHHLERMMPEEMRAAIRKEYAKRVADAYKLATKNGNKDIVQFIDLVNEFAVSGKAKTADAALKLITDGKVPYQFYQLFNTSEFWAVNGAELMSNRFAAKDSVFGKIRQWFKEFVQKAKSILGMKSDAAIIRAMDGLLAGDGEFVSKDMLAMTDKFFAVGGQQNTPTQLPEETKAQAAQRKVQDKFNRFTVIKEWLKEQGVQLSEQADVYKAEERMHSRFANKAEDFRTKLVEPLIKKIQAAGFSMDDVSLFLHAQHAEERNEQIAKINPKVADGSGMSTSDANKVLAAAPAELKLLANEFRQITEMTKQMLLDAGIISQDMVNAWEGAYSNYVPLKGGPDEKAKSGTGKGLHVNGKMKRALGHGKREGGEWIAENILADYERAVMLAEKNRVGHHLVKMALEAGRDDLITLNKPEKRAVLRNDHAYELRYHGSLVSVFSTEEAAKTAKTMLGKTGVTITKTNDPSVIYSASPMLQDNEANVYVNGHAIRVQINDELLAQAYKNLGAEPLNAIFSAGRMLNGYLSKAYTGYNPEFILTNIVRDFTTGLINITGEEGALFAAKAAKNYVSSFGSLLKYAVSGKETQWIKDYRDDGGNTGAAYLSDLERLGKEIKTEYDSYKGVIENLKARDGAGAARAAGRNLFNVSLKWIEHLNQAGENAMRLSIYRAAIESGKTRAEAASLAKNSTVNFNRKGELGANINALYLFFNAGVQGTSALAHAHFKGKHKYQAWALSSGMIGLGFLAAAGFGGGDEDDYDRELSDYDKSRNLVIRAGDSWVKIPVPYGYGFFYNLGRHLADAERKGEWGKMPWHLASDFVGEFTPFSGVVAGKEPDIRQGIYALPTAFQIPGAVAVNRTGMGSPIFPESKFDENQPDNLKMWRNTKGTIADDLAQVLDKAGLEVSPETLKYLGRTATGGSGAFVGSVFDAGKLTLEGADLETKEMPFVRKFVKEGSASDYRSAFYEAKLEASKAADDFARAKKMGDMMSAKKLMEDNGELIAMDKYADRLSKMIKAKRDMQDVVKQDEKLTVAEKRLKLKALELEEQKVYDRYLDIFKQRTQERRERLQNAF